MSPSRSHPLWETYCTPMRSMVNRLESQGRSPISAAFYIAKLTGERLR